MSTAQELINSAAKYAGILAEGQALEAGINDDALRRLNLMFSRWKNNDIDLGIDELGFTDELYLDDSDEEIVELGLALRLMRRHKRPMNQVDLTTFSDGFTELQTKYGKTQLMELDSSLTSRRYRNAY